MIKLLFALLITSSCLSANVDNKKTDACMTTASKMMQNTFHLAHQFNEELLTILNSVQDETSARKLPERISKFDELIKRNTIIVQKFISFMIENKIKSENLPGYVKAMSDHRLNTIKQSLMIKKELDRIEDHDWYGQYDSIIGNIKFLSVMEFNFSNPLLKSDDAKHRIREFELKLDEKVKELLKLITEIHDAISYQEHKKELTSILESIRTIDLIINKYLSYTNEDTNYINKRNNYFERINTSYQAAISKIKAENYFDDEELQATLKDSLLQSNLDYQKHYQRIKINLNGMYFIINISQHPHY